MKNQRKFRKLMKRLISGVSAIALSVGLLASIPASADDSNIGYKYTLFAYSSEDGAITSSAANFCVNGNIATNGTISAGQNFNVNGEKKEHANEAMPDLSKAINEKFFAENVETKAENYKNEDVNINVESPLDVKGKAELKGNIKLAAGVKAMGDIVLSGGVLNNDNTVLFSENGSININSENVSLTGLIYAPKGNIVIESKSLNLNSVVMIANKITLNAPNVNINNSASMAKFVQEAIDKNGNSSSGDENEEDPEPVTDPAIYAYGEYNEETKTVDIEWYSNVTGEFAVLESMNGTDYTVVSKVSDDTKYSIKVASDFIKKFYKVTIIKDGKTIESIPFAITKETGKYTTELLDTDKDGLADLYEEMLGTDKTLPDTDKDGLTDYEEAYITNTNPTKYDSVTEGISDADADNDKDGLTNKKEIEIKTDPNSDDTDGDNLKDGDEVSKYNTDPTKRDTDGDELEDGDEFKFNCDPNKKDTDNNGIIDGKEKHQQTLDVVPDNKEQAVTKVSVSMNASGNIEKTTTVESIMNKDVLCSNVVGLVGEPFSIESKSSFDKATITFTVDKTKLGETEFDNLMFLWYDRENDNFVELETSHDAANSTVSIETTHFSEYILVDAEEWFENWKKIEKETNWTERRNTTIMYYITKCDDKNDPKYLDPDRDNSIFKHYSNNREMVFKNLLLLMSDDDRIGFSSTDDNGKWVSTVFMPKDHFDISKGVNINLSKCGLKNDEAFEIVYAADDLMTFCKNYNNRIVYFTDRDIKVSRSSYSAEFYKNYKKVPVIFVCTGNFDKTNIQKIADETGGAVFNLTSIDELGLALNNYDENPLEKLLTDMDYLLIDPGFKDSDGDGFSDIEEEYGIVTSGGRKIQTNPETKHSDNDGLADNEEIDVDKSAEKVIIKGKKVRKAYHHMKSDPTKDDSDGDGINDYYPTYTYTDSETSYDKDNLPLEKGIHIDGINQAVIGDMTIVSCTNDIGHAFLVYKSYIKDVIDFNGLTKGYEYKTWKAVAPCYYTIEPYQSVSIGNAGKGLFGSSQSSETSSTGIDGDSAGVYFNREFAVEYKNYCDHYDCNHPEKFKQEYDQNLACTQKVTAYQLQSIIKYCSKNNYYNLSTNNCSHVARNAWNCAFPYYRFESNGYLGFLMAPGTLQFDIAKTRQAFVYNMYSVLELDL
ncbi:MAG: hypothetical protein K6F27_11050 [Ruminococcus sp.]|nr:hypothetical protein [Ruminococcus sp.]